MALIQPSGTAPIAGTLAATSQYQTFFRDLVRIVKSLQEGTDTDLSGITIDGGGSINVTGSLSGGTVRITLSGDTSSPGSTWYYGTTADGTKGWYSLSAAFEAGEGLVHLIDGYAILGSLDSTDDLPGTGVTGTAYEVDGSYYYWDSDSSTWAELLSAGIVGYRLDELADSGEGALLAITRDEYGRVSGTRVATITGTAGEINVANGSAAAGLPTISLADLPNSGTGTAVYKTTRDAKGRTSGQVEATTTDLPEGSNLYYTDARADARIAAQKGQPNGLATLGADSKIPSAQLPALAITETFVVASQAAQLALTAQEGDVAVRTDQSKNYIHNGGTTGTMSDWTELLTPAAPVQSVNGKTGNVTLVTDDIAESGTPTNQWFTAARVRDVVLTGLSTATNAAIAAADSILVALGKLQAQLNSKEPSITAGTTAQFLRGDKTWSNELLGDMTFRSASVNNSYRKAAVTASVLSESLMGLNGYGANGSAEVLGGTLNFRPGQAWTGSASGCDFAVRLNTYSTNTLAEKWRIRGDGAMVPGSDNAQTCGSASLRWSTVYAGTGTINTSDARDKTAVMPLATNELACALAMGREIGWFRFTDAIAAKGDKARQHVGMTVQRAIEIMQQYGLDPFRWGFICHDEWGPLDRIEDEDGTVVQEARPAGDRYSFREGELHGFILRGLAQRQEAIEARLAALESA